MRLVLFIALLVAGSCVHAQPADTMIHEGNELVRFEQARALAVDPAGRLYVVDAGKDAVFIVSPQGQPLSTLGGPGGNEGAFYDPADIDPTNGLVWIVADAGNSRLQRFSRTSLFLSALPVQRVSRGEFDRAVQTVFNLGDESGVQEADGRPIAVISNTANEMFAIDAAQGYVLKWDAARRLERTIGGFGAGAGRLEDPVALALDDTYLYVADRGQRAIAVYDHLGGFVRLLAQRFAEDVRAITVAGGELWIVLPDRLLVYDAQGRLARTIDVRLSEPLVDVAPVGDRLYLLTPTRLLLQSARDSEQ